MQKKQLLPKIGKKDYNNMLEIVLEKKDFTADTKNLLLSMLYKIEISYQDYETVKRDVKGRNEFLEEIINTIKQRCSKIRLIEPKSENAKILEEKNENAIIQKDTIIAYPTEMALMTGVCRSIEKIFHMDNEYRFIKLPLQKLLKKGYDINAKETIYNFDGWSWNIQIEEKNECLYNLLYQNIQSLLGQEFIEMWKNDNSNTDYIKKAKERIIAIYGGENINIFISSLKKVLLNILVNEFPTETQDYLEEGRNQRQALEYLENKAQYLRDISEQKKNINKKIKDIDNMLIDKEMLSKEYQKRNAELPLEKKIFSMRHLNELLKKERQALLNELKDCNKMLEPEIYIKKKEELKAKAIKFDEIQKAKESKNTFYDEVINFQKVFLKLLETRVEKIENKKEIINLIYLLRYYKNIKIDEQQSIKDIKELDKSLSSFEMILILKATNSNVFVKFQEDGLLNTQIILKIIDTKIIDLENIWVLSRVVNRKINLEIYDGEVLDNTLCFSNEVKVISIRPNKKIKLFN